ncbi:MAG: MarR family transcriptional regulator [Pseudomonadota bacterium]
MPTRPADALCQFVSPFLRFLREGLAGLNMSPARFQLLQTLSMEGERSMNELAERLSVSKRNVTSLVDSLEKDGLAKRQPHPTDRRSTLVVLTPTGAQRFSEAAKLQRTHLEGLLANLNERQQVEMAEALNALTHALTRGKSPD